MNPGLLNVKVQLEKKINSKNPLIDSTFELYKSIWCNMSNITVKEKITAESLNAKASKKLVIRYRKELDLDYNENATKEFRITYKTRVYNISYICPIKDNEFMELLLESE